MRLIDADALMNEASKLWAQMPDGEELCKELIKVIHHAPTVDAEIVVRCQNCKHHGSCWYEDIPGWFCADGEVIEYV